MEDRLPPDTFFFVKWAGAASLKDAQAKNHFLQLLADPEVAPLEVGAASYLGASVAKENAKHGGPQLPEIVSLLENGGVLGFTSAEKPATSSKEVGAKNTPSFFVVYDSTGKKDLLQKLNEESKTKNKDNAKFSKYDFDGVSVDVEEKPAEKDYSAYVGNYYISSGSKDLEEDLIARFHGADVPGTSLTRASEYQASRKYAGTNACIEMFGRVPDLSKLIPEDPKNPTASRIVQSLHLEKIHAFTFSVDLSGEATRTRGALLGDASPGTIFDLFGASSGSFQSMAAVSNSADFQISRANLAGLYNYVLNSVQGKLPPQQDASLKATQAMAQSYLGMSLGDALGLFSGEFSQASYFSPDGATDKLFAATIEKPEDVLRILRATLGSFILSEDTSGPATFLDFTYPYKDPATGTDRKKFYYLAVTPHMLFAAPRKAMVRDAMARLNSPGQAASPAGPVANPEFVQMRAALPENLSGLSVADLRQIPLDKLLANFVQQAEEQRKQSKSNEQAPDFSWLKQVKTEALTRHLHLSVGGWWKDSNGVYFDSSFQ